MRIDFFTEALVSPPDIAQALPAKLENFDIGLSDHCGKMRRARQGGDFAEHILFGQHPGWHPGDKGLDALNRFALVAATYSDAMVVMPVSIQADITDFGHIGLGPPLTHGVHKPAALLPLSLVDRIEAGLLQQFTHHA